MIEKQKHLVWRTEEWGTVMSKGKEVLKEFLVWSRGNYREKQ